MHKGRGKGSREEKKKGSMNAPRAVAASAQRKFVSDLRGTFPRGSQDAMFAACDDDAAMESAVVLLLYVCVSVWAQAPSPLFVTLWM